MESRQHSHSMLCWLLVPSTKHIIRFYVIVDRNSCIFNMFDTYFFKRVPTFHLQCPSMKTADRVVLWLHFHFKTSDKITKFFFVRHFIKPILLSLCVYCGCFIFTMAVFSWNFSQKWLLPFASIRWIGLVSHGMCLCLYFDFMSFCFVRILWCLRLVSFKSFLSSLLVMYPWLVWFAKPSSSSST